ncbi:MAG: TetR/AcrR family transcriptional regulator [Anaerobutyricum hallii]|uniref:TetR/AcrR family transcriptional regulator n=3 Tax=Lachnospiraceae TaxID=186803 RepID=UPI00399451B8
MGNRKEEILIVALHLFARDGYEAVSVSQIAGELDMTKGALYRHYKSKRDIFDCIVQRMEQQDGEQARRNEVPEESIEKVPEEYQNVSVEDFVGYSKSMFEYWTEDDFASSFRKMLTLEQFRNEEMQNLYQQYLVSGPAEYVKDLFKNMEIKNPEEKAVKFYANMFFYYSVYDGAADKAKVKGQFEHMLNKIVEEMKIAEQKI